jgi:hypothetical protein
MKKDYVNEKAARMKTTKQAMIFLAVLLLLLFTIIIRLAIGF